MPRAFLIKKKREEERYSLESTVLVGVQHSGTEVEERETSPGTEPKTDDEGQKSERKSMEKEESCARRMLSHFEESRPPKFALCESPVLIKDTFSVNEDAMTSSPEPSTEPHQQFPTDLSFKSSRTLLSQSQHISLVTSPERLPPEAKPPLPSSRLATTLSEPPQRLHPHPPCKRPSDFSTAFLLSQHSEPKQLSSPFITFQPSSPTYSASSSSSVPSPKKNVSSACDKGSDSDAFAQHIPALSLPCNYTPPCSSRSSWLDPGSPPSPSRPSALLAPSQEGHMRREIASPEITEQDLETHMQPSYLPLLHVNTYGPSAFRRAAEDNMKSSSSKSSSSATTASSQSRKMMPLAMTSLPASFLTSPTRSLPSAPLHHATMATSERLTSSRLLPLKTLSLGNLGESRRGSSTSPAHSDRTSSGSGSPDVSPNSSPTQPLRYGGHGDLFWASPASMTNPFFPAALSSQAHNPFLPMGLRYLSGMPLPTLVKPLSEMSIPTGYSSATPDDLTTAFKSARLPFAHHAAVAFYSSLRNSVGHPFAFSPPLGDSPGKTGDQTQLQSLGRLEAFHNLEKPHPEPVASFKPLAQPQLHFPGSGSASTPMNTLLPPAPASCSPSPTKDLDGIQSPEMLLSFPRDAGMDQVGQARSKSNKEHEPVRYQCEACSKSYSTYSGLSKHRQFHCTAQVKKEFNCKYCDKSYVSLGALKMHIRTHTLPCKCTVCGKAFSRPWLLQGHVRTHTGEKPFSCPHCARAFADRSNLRAHLQTHSQVKKYNCRACSKTFSRMSLLLKHEDGCCSGIGLEHAH